ncbi:MAG TPA: HK97 family phage prohead protease [Lacunisphaera sp.]|nr:HK97 family phage prohead protease [Lacunisphaera sp.]
MNPEQLAQILRDLKSPEALERFVRELTAKQPPTKARDAGEREVIRRSFGIETKADTIDEKNRTVRVIASTSAIDSYDEIVDQNWRLERYNKNPVVLYGHNRGGFLGMGGDPRWTLPIGFSTEVTARDRLEATLNFVDEKANPMAVEVWEQYRQRSMRAVSVGFYPHDVYREVRDDVEIYHLDDNELFEISAVPLPANADAVALSAERATERESFRARALNNPKSTKTTIQLPAGKALEKTTMDIETLKAELETLKTALKTANETIGTKTAELATKTGELAAKQTELDVANEKVKATETELGKVKGELESSQTTVKKLETELAGKTAKLDEVDKAAQKADLDHFEGKKFAPAEREDMAKLRASNPELFASQMKNRPDLPHTKDITGDDKHATQNHVKTGSKIAKSARDAASKAVNAG